MNLLALIFTFVCYGLFVALYNGETADEAVFPTFNPPSVSFATIPSGCGGFFDCTEYVGKVITNMVLGVVYAVLLLVELIRLLVAIAVLIATNAFTGFDGAPVWFNAIILTIFGGATIIIIFKAVRSGETDAE